MEAQNTGSSVEGGSHLPSSSPTGSMFDTHKLSEDGFVEVKNFKTVMASAVEQVLEQMPEGREKAVFKTKIEEAMFFGTKAFASKPGNWTEIVRYNGAPNSVAPQ